MIQLPPDIEGFADWVRTDYLTDRWSRIDRRPNSVTVWSGEHPAFARFQDDLRPRLHEHGLVIEQVRRDVRQSTDDGLRRVHWVRAIPAEVSDA